MGFFFHKSIKFGPFRVNLSKSGVGVSAGVKGARISKGPRGTYINVGRGGLYYRQKLDTTPAVAGSSTTSNSWNEAAVDVPRSQLIESIKPPPKRALPTVIHIIYIWLTLGVIALVAWYGWNRLPHTAEGRNQLAVMLFTIPPAIWVVGFIIHRFVARASYGSDLHPLYYELDQSSSARFAGIKRACETLTQAHKVWALQSHPGGSYIMHGLTPVWVGQQRPPLITTNVDVWAIAVGNWRMFFLPDNIYVFQNNAYSTISYESLKVSPGERRAFEYHGYPSDAQVVDRTWQHTRKDGFADLRYKHNPMIPIVLYGLIQIESDSGWSLILQTSNAEVAKQFVNQFRSVLPHRYKQAHQQPPRGNRQQSQNKEQRTYSSSTRADKSPYDVLGVAPGASLSDITAAYYEQARKNHPDKVANLDPEFRELAERRMKAINAAYQELKRRYE
jgi:hypothetical protein